MDVKSLLKKLRDRHIHISLSGENLQVSSDDPELPSDLLQEIRSGKAAIIGYLKSQHSHSVPSASIPRIASTDDGYVLSSSQYRLWLLCRLSNASVAYNIPGVFQFEGSLDMEAFTAAFNAIVERHENIRTVFLEDAEGRPRQYVRTAEELGLAIRTEDLRNEPGREELAKELVQQEMLTSMDLALGPLLTATLYRIEDNKWIFVYVMHHIITDGWSMGVLFTELIRLYNARVRKERSPLQPLRIQYRDYAAWQQEQLSSGGMQAHRDYWLKQFEGELPVLELPGDRPRPAIKTYNGGDVKGKIDARLAKELKELCQQQGGTLFMGLLAVVKALFYRYAGHEDITIGSPIAGRQHADLEEQIGFYVNTLALRSRFSGAKGFLELLKEVKQVTLDAYEHEVYPFDELVGALNLRHDMSRSPLFDVMVVLQNNEVNKDLKLSLEELNISTCYHDEETTVSKFDLVFTFVEGSDGIHTAIEYNSDIYLKSSIERMAVHLEQLLAALVAQPERPIRELDYLNEEEKRRLVVEFNDTSIEYPRDKTIVELFAEQVQKAPERTALVFEGREWSYRELHEKSSQLAHYLKDNYNIQPGGMVGILLDRSDKLIIAILAALKAGAAYVPIDIDYPDARKEFIINDTGLGAIITQKEFTSALEHFNGGVFLIDLQLDTLAATSVEMPEVPGTSSDVAYVMYTSGSTGNPKGVMVEHRGVVRLVRSANYVNLTGEEVLLAAGSVSFDASTYEYWSMLLNGGQLVMSRKETVLDTALLAQEIQDRKVSMMFFTTGWLNQLIDENIGIFEGLHTLLTGGDKISPPHIKKLRDRYPQMQIVNGYGPTENTTFSLAHDIEAAEETIPIGKPLSNSTAYILDAQQQLVPVGVVGEICVGGDGLARGYLNNPGLTAEKFILHSLSFIGETRLYKTGDLGKWTEAGVVEFLGRRDAQVKIRGYRVELGEIEAALLSQDKVSSAVVIARSNAVGEKELAAYIVGSEDLDVSAIRARLGRTLPGYMRPTHFIQLPALPLTSSGKVDYKSLPEPGELSLSSGVEYIAPRNQTEEKLAIIWQEILGKEKVGVKDDFFELGGHSLRASRLGNQVHRVFEVKLALNTFFEKPTLEEQARIIAQSTKTGYLDIEKAPHQEYYPLSSAQKRIFFLQEFAPQSSSYNIPMVNYLGREVDPERIATVLRQLVARHESLRTSFEKIDGAVMQKIHSDAPFELDTHECLPAEFNDYLQSYIRPFNLAQAPLLRSSLVHVTGVGYAWIVDIHHIISDGTSQQVLTDDFLRLYRGEKLPELRLQYRDFSEWQNGLQQSGELEKQKEYWRSQFTGSISRLNLPADRPRPSAFNFEGDVHNFVLDRELTAQVRAFCRQTHGTLQMALLSALNVLFHRYSGQQDITIGCGIAGRRHPDLERIVGMFVNTLAIRNYPEAEKTFGQFYKEVSAACLAAYDNQDVQFEDLVDMLQVERDPSANPIFDVTLVVQNFVQSQEDKSVLLTQVEEVPELNHQGNRTAKFDMSWFVFEMEDDIFINLEYYSAIFDASTIGRMVQHFINVLRTAVSYPATSLGQVQVLSAGEQQLLLQQYVDGGQPEFGGESLHELFEKQNLLTPGNIALVSGDASYTYKELSEQSNQLAHFLISIGLKKGDPVGVLQLRNKDLLVSLLAILKAGGVYVPLDSDYPEERLLFMLQDTGAEVLLTSSSLIELGNRLQWREKGVKHLVCVDSSSIYSERGMLRNELMRKDLWDHVGETATDAISAGGWMSSYTGEYISAEEMQEYSENAFLKLKPYLHKDMKVLEIGCSSGLTLFQVAPHVGAYHGTDLSSSILEGTRKEVQEHGYSHITLTCLPAHDINQLDDEGFDLVIINSVIQSFDGHNYLRDVLVKVIDKMKDTGLLFIGDIMDEDRRQALIDDLNAFREANEGKGYRTKTSVSDELFISREYLNDLVADGIGLASAEYTGKIYTIPNELTEFRFDALLQVDKQQSKQQQKKRHQYDLTHISAQDNKALSITLGNRDTAYVIYTSGSTGKPKGVMVAHSNIAAFLHKCRSQFGSNGAVTMPVLASNAFDISLFETFLPLITGGTVMMLGSSQVKDTAYLLEQLKSATAFHAVPALMAQVTTHIAESGTSGEYAQITDVFTGGDAVPTSVLAGLRTAFPQARIHVLYGPTESTIFVTSKLYNPGQEDFKGSLIGSPDTHARVYITDASGQLVPVGVAGEICIGGAIVSKGYLNQPELTAEKFVEDNFHKGSMIYRSGDLGRWLPNGGIEFLGRKDNQVKIRGYRIELGEVENALRRHSSVREAVVVKATREGDHNLVAYVVGNGAITTADLRNHLGKSLPAYMMPAHFVQLEALPLTSNGKVDRKKLPDPHAAGMASGTAYVAPRTSTEEKLAQVWQELLGREKIGAKDNFFESGGHSLKATRLTNHIQKIFEVSVELKELFLHPVLEDQAKLIDQAAASSFTAIPLAAQQESYVLSSAQRRLWILSRFEEANRAYNMPGVCVFKGSLDPKALEAAFASLIERHESLRTTFRENEHGEARQVIHAANASGFILHHLDIRNHTDREQSVRDLVQEDFYMPFDLTSGPLLRASLYQTEDSKWVFSYVMHHIISDGWSMNILVSELLQLYNAHAKSEGSPLEPLRIQYKDYAAWQQQQLSGASLAAHKEYWLKQFEGELPVLELSGDRPRPAVKTYNGRTVGLYFNEELGRGLRMLSQQQGGTLFMGILAAVNALLYRYTAQEDIIIGSPIAGREHADLEGQIGFYLNTLALRSRFSGSDSFHQLLNHVKQVTLDAYQHQVYPFDELLDNLNLQRDMSRSALFDVMVILQNNESDGGDALQNIDGLSVNHYGGGGEILISKFDLEFNFMEAGEGLQLVLAYNSDIYSASTIQRLTRHLEQLLYAITRDPLKPIKQLDYLDREEKQQLLSAFNNTSVDYPRDKTIVELFAEQAEKTPGRTALAFEGSEMSYRELHERSNQLAHYLKENHYIQPDDMVGILLDRSDNTIIAILGVLKSGAAYVPIDADYPDTRKEFIMKDTGIKALITQSDYIFDLGHFGGGVFAMDLQLDTLETSTQMPELSITPSNLAYVMYTSGSTGNPKGVMVEHRSVVRLVKSANYINLRGDEVMVSTGAVSFDATSFEFWAMLLNGGQLVMSRKEVLLDNSLLLQEVRNRKANVLWFTTGWLNQVIDESIEIFEGIRAVLSGGEKISRPHIKKLKARYPQMQFVHCYGPTENTGFSLACDIEEIEEIIPIGKPISNSTAFILDAQHQPVPIGVAGEICVGGDGLARGYLNNPDLTAGKFITIDLPLLGETRIYKTGDLGRWREDGLIEFIGRRDAQVKIRGFRIELGEIENAMQSHPAVDSAVVIAKESGEEKELVAYVVGSEELHAADLAAYLGSTLPSYMVPAHFMQLDELPLNANGKVDRKKLPDPTTGSLLSDVEYIAPRNEVEEKLARIWKDILGKETISVKDNFFDLGGHSLRVTRLASQVHKEFNVKIELKDLFEVAVLEDLARLIGQSARTSFTTIEQVEPQADYALSSSQRRLWVLSQFEEGNIAYNMPGVYLFEGNLEAKALEAAFASLIERHESLRTIFRENERGEIRQVIQSPEASGFILNSLDLRNNIQREQSVNDLVQDDFGKAFDLSSGPLLRASLYQVEDNKWVFSYVMHHIISDGWSMNILIRELLELYNAHAKGEDNPLEPLRIQYKDYAAWQQQQLNGESLQLHKDYWLKQFEGEIPVLELPADKPRPAAKTYNGSKTHLILNTELTQGLKALSQHQGGTLFMGVLAAVKALLYRYTSQEDIIIGSPIAGREHADLEGQIGFYLNTLALRSRFSGNDSFHQLLDQVKQVTLDAYEHQVYPFDELVDALHLRRDMSRSALFDVMVVLQNNESDGGDVLQSIDNFSVSGYGSGEFMLSKFDLEFDFIETGGELHLTLRYNSDIYSPSTIERLALHLEQLLSAIIREPQKPVGRIDYLDGEETQQLLVKFNDTAVDYPRDKTIVELFAEQAQKTPDRIALAFENSQTSYRELHERSNQLAHYLKENHNIQPDDMVGIMLDRSDKTIIAILGVLKSGAAYVPIDADYPDTRKEFIMKDTGIKALITQSDFVFDLDHFDGGVFAMDLQLDMLETSTQMPQLSITPSSLAYVMYTSGSTGNPKGVMVEHRSVVRLVKSANYINLTGDEVMVSTGAVSFDATSFEFWAMLLNGGQLVMSRKEVLLDNSLLLQEVRNRNANVLWFTTGWLNQVIDESIEIFEGIRAVLSGGEKISRPHIKKLKARYPQMQFVHCYGPTENTGFSLACDIEEVEEIIPIGKPISNSTAFILDAQHQPVPIGVAGEICVGGEGLARGYLNNPDLTAGKFITIDLPLLGETRIYKTGDLGRWREDGLIEFIGRRDAQVKIRGFRIELGEIENVLQSHPAVDSAVVIAKESGEEKELVAYVVGSEELHAADLAAYLGSTLPAYMVPAHFVQLDELPLNANGKVDRKKLPDPTTGSLLSDVEYIAPRNEVEEKLARIWKDILGKETISVKDNFFDLGGHSLRVTRLASQVHREFNVKIELKDLFEVAVLEDLAQLIGQSVKTSYATIEPVEQQEDYALSSSQRRLWVLSQFAEANVAYNMPGVHVFEGGFDPKALEAAFASLIERHESLRTVFRENEQGDIRQVILPASASGFNLIHLDLRNDMHREQAARDLVQGDFVKPFDLSSGPLLRASLYQMEDSKWVFSYVMHHIISDGWSMNILIRELLQLYHAHAKGSDNPLTPLRIQYKDYAAWQQQQLTGESLKAHEEYWLKRFEGEIPVLELPTDKPRPSVKTHNGRRIHFGLNAELGRGIKTLSQQQGGTLFMGLLAAVNTLLYRYTSQEDIIIGSPIAGREHADLEGQIGFYLNTLALRSRFSGNDSFHQLLDQVKQVTLDAYQHQVYPFDELVENLNLRRDMSRSAMFDVMVILQNNESDGGDVLLNIDNLTVSGYGGGEITVSKFDLVFEFMEAGEELHLVLGYNTDIFREGTIQRMGSHLQQLLSSLLQEPQKPIAQLAYLGDAEEQQLLQKFNDTSVDFPQDKTIMHLFEEQVERTPNEPAVVSGKKTLTYRQLNAQANRLAHYLKTAYAIAPDDLIAIKLERSERMIVALLGILKSGGAYLPIDPEYPQERIDYMISDSGCKLVIDEDWLESFRLEEDQYDSDNLTPSSLTPSSLAYVIYTSGSTGKPKGVMMEHGSVLNYLLGFRHKHRVDVDFLFTSNIAFDASLKQIFLPLINGRKVHVYNLLRDLASLPEYVSSNGIRVLNAAPGVVNELLNLPDGRRLFETLQTIIIGGEAFDQTLVEKLRAYNPALVIINAYGPTETCANSLTCELGSRISLGTPLPNTTVYLLDANGKLVPVGVAGEICVSGAGLARGYLNRPELTAEKFTDNPYEPGKKMYRTGDLGRWLPDGTIEFLGRKDDQVKIRGHRIELGEIENALRGMEAITAAVVTAHTSANGAKELVAYIVAKGELGAAAIRSALSGTLPSYMIPTHFVQLDELPLTSNGKVDRKRLPNPESGQQSISYEAPRNEAEQRMALAWQEALSREQVGIRDNFFDLGGHSLNAIRLQRLLNKKYGFRIGIRDIYNHPTIEELLAASPGSSKLVQLGTGQPGAQRIYMIPPILGNAIVYKPLADKLKELNCYGFQYSGLERDEPLYTSIEQAAQEFSEEIMKKEQDGNFVLLGYSMGAVIAFEMTRILEEQFGPIRLVLVDRPPVNAEPESLPDDASMSRHLDWLVEQYKAFTGDVHVDAEGLKRFLFNNMEVMQKYRQSGKIKSDIQALECKEKRASSMKDWANYTEGKLKHRFIKGTHWEALFPANLPLLEKAVRG